MRVASPSFLFVIMCIALVHNIPQIVIGQQDTIFQTYTNTKLGFIVDYPSDWIVSEAPTKYYSTVFIESPDATFSIEVSPSEYRTVGEMANLTSEPMQNNGDFRLVEMDTDNYFLGGHPAARYVFVYTPPNGTEQRLVYLETTVDGKYYGIESRSKAGLYHDYEPIFQRMVESFKTIKLQ